MYVELSWLIGFSFFPTFLSTPNFCYGLTSSSFSVQLYIAILFLLNSASFTSFASERPRSMIGCSRVLIGSDWPHIMSVRLSAASKLAIAMCVVVVVVVERYV